MVDALRKVSRLLRRGGAIVDLRPTTRCAHLVSLVAGRRRISLGRFAHETNASFRAADRAVRAVVGARVLRARGSGRRAYQLPFANLRELRGYARDQIHGNPLAPGGWPRLAAAWRARPAGARLELTERFRFAVLEPS